MAIPCNIMLHRRKLNSVQASEFLVVFLIALLTIHLFQFQKVLYVSAQGDSNCPPSSCGKIPEIKYPFRLKGDPEGCGDPRYELVCAENKNQTTLTLSLTSAEYIVESINYNNYTIRLVDPAVQLESQPTNFDHCVSIPRYNLYIRNFTSAENEIGAENKIVAYSIYNFQAFTNSASISPSCFDSYFPSEINTLITFFWCSRPVMDDLYTDIILCSDPESWSGRRNSKAFVYVATGLSDRYWEVGCQAKRITLTSMNITSVWGNISYITIRDALAFGFELSWLDGFCDYYCGSSSICFLDDFNSSSGLPCRSGEEKLRHCPPIAGDGPDFLQAIKNAIKATRSGLINGLRFFFHLHMIDHYDVPNSTTGILMGEYIFPTIFGVRLLFGMVILTTLLVYRRRRKHLSVYENIETFLTHNNNLMPIRYSYGEIKKMTRGFKDRLGEGGYGCVYKGKLRSGNFVAIKMLIKSKANGQDFINEVATIGRIHHVNVVQLIGFCVEGSKRALVYDFMPNGSLDKHIFSKDKESKSSDLGCDAMYSISLGVAQGIKYLHQGCDMQILHFDIKPHNILLDDNFVPKISDFGLARLYAIDDSIVSVTARGTLGYMAPELYYKNIGRVSYKADVYSFGMLLMEMASRRKNLNVVTENLSGNNLSQIYFPTWIHDQFSAGRDVEIEDIASEEEKDLVTKMIVVALWCIQMNPRERPSMKKVVEMLEGELERIEMPPRPSLYPEGRPPATVSTSNQEQSSDRSEYVTEISSETTSTAI